MGGIGSGNWYRFGKKATVEESLTLGIGDFKKRIYPHSSGTFTWTWAGGNQSSIGYFVTWRYGRPTVTLHYRWEDSENVRIPIRLQTTPTQFGGQRSWFTCPLIVDGVACNRRVGKLYLPPGARYFGCRKCHELTYRSCQKAHQAERLFGRLLGGFGIDERKPANERHRLFGKQDGLAHMKGRKGTRATYREGCISRQMV